VHVQAGRQAGRLVGGCSRQRAAGFQDSAISDARQRRGFIRDRMSSRAPRVPALKEKPKKLGSAAHIKPDLTDCAPAKVRDRAGARGWIKLSLPLPQTAGNLAHTLISCATITAAAATTSTSTSFFFFLLCGPPALLLPCSSSYPLPHCPRLPPSTPVLDPARPLRTRFSDAPSGPAAAVMIPLLIPELCLSFLRHPHCRCCSSSRALAPVLSATRQLLMCGSTSAYCSSGMLQRTTRSMSPPFKSVLKSVSASFPAVATGTLPSLQLVTLA
jgi:hypothetical protein